MAASLATPNTEASILSRLLDLQAANLTPAAAEFLVKIRFPDQDVSRMNDLSELARQGALTADQKAELDSYIHVSNLLMLMQSKARRLIESQGSG